MFKVCGPRFQIFWSNDCSTKGRPHTCAEKWKKTVIALSSGFLQQKNPFLILCLVSRFLSFQYNAEFKLSLVKYPLITVKTVWFVVAN